MDILNIKLEAYLEKCKMSSAQANELSSLETPEVEGCELAFLQPATLNKKKGGEKKIAYDIHKIAN